MEVASVRAKKRMKSGVKVDPSAEPSLGLGKGKSTNEVAPKVGFTSGRQLESYVSPLIITQDNIIVSGHRRQRACIELGIEEVEVIVRDYESDLDILEALILENKVRIKTSLQKAHEAETLLEVEKSRADERRVSTQFGADTVRADLPTPENKGRARDFVAEQVGFKSGREVERAINTAKVIREAESEGDTEKANKG